MKKNTTIEGIGLTWDDTGRYRGVRLRRTETGYAVVAFWFYDKNSKPAIDDADAQRKKLFDTSKSCNIVAGGVGCGSGILDLDAPDLIPEEEKDFLAYELPRHVPTPPEKLVWHHRRLPNGLARGKQCLRIVYITKKTWADWLENAGGIADVGVDALMPPAAALDPVLAGYDFIANTGENGMRYRATPDQKNHRIVVPAGKEENNGFGACPKHPLDLEFLHVGELKKMTAQEQATFAGAVVLAMYALDDSFVKDRKNHLPLQKTMRPKHRGRWRKIAMAIIVYTAVVGLFVLARYAAQAKGVLNEIKQAQRQAEAQIAEIQSTEKRREIINELNDNFDELNLPQPALPENLAELTRLLNDEYWVSNFQWDTGRIDAEIRSSVDDLSFIEILEASPMFSDVALTRKITDADNQVVMSLQIMAVLDERQKSRRDSKAPGNNVAADGGE
jgi:Tfp pilus assembly protein PilN